MADHKMASIFKNKHERTDQTFRLQHKVIIEIEITANPKLLKF